MAPSLEDDFGGSLFEEAKTMSQMKRSRIDLTRRYVFLCPTALSKHFQALPLAAKESSLLVFRCARSFVFKDPPSVRRTRLQARVETNIGDGKKGKPSSAPKSGLSALYRSEFSDDFLQFVLAKEKEGCVFWYKPDQDLEKMSSFFEQKVDPLDEQPYRPLLLDAMWWRVRFDRTSARYVGNPRGILGAIAAFHHGLGRERDLDLPSLQELIFQSNPTLEPVVKWPHAPSMRFLPARVEDTPQTQYKGYIEANPRRTDLPGQSVLERLQKWPDRPRARLDNLHHHWQAQEMSMSRQNVFSVGGSSVLRASSENPVARG
mmetsp:Transcript_46937/g.109738  ORF Transcript_46937/g.109738 Transcript_46937/m.109738 type:complete len:318 (+) Transcript_46937:48-1001(+)